MRKISARLAKPARSMQIGEWLDRWLPRSSHVAQVLLLLLGIFGYFYTVLPIYQKSLLDEDIAEKTIELRKKEKLIEERATELRNKDQQIAEIERRAVAAQAARVNAESRVQRAVDQAALAESDAKLAKDRAATATATANSRYVELRAQMVKTYSSRLRSTCITGLSLGHPSFVRDSLKTCIATHIEGVPKALAPLNRGDQDNYVNIVRRLLNEFDPKFGELYAYSEKKRVEFIDRQMKKPTEGQPNDSSNKRFLLDEVMTEGFLARIFNDQFEIANRYTAILDEMTDLLVQGVLN